MAPVRILSFTQKEKEHGKHEVYQNHQKNRYHDGARCGAPHLFRAGARRESFMASNGRDRNPEHDALDQPGRDVPQEQRVQRSNDVPMHSETRLRHTEKSAAVYAHRVCPNCKARQRSEEHTSELQSHLNLVCRLLLEKKKNSITQTFVNRGQGGKLLI